MFGEIRQGCAMIGGLIIFLLLIILVIRMSLAKWWRLNQRKCCIRVMCVVFILISLEVATLLKPMWLEGIGILLWILASWKLQSAVRKDLYKEDMAGRLYFSWKNSGQPIPNLEKNGIFIAYEEKAKRRDAEWPRKIFMVCAILPAMIVGMISILVRFNLIDNFLLFLIE